MARRRYQRGSLSKDGDRWVARWREDVVLPSGDVKRIRRKEILGNIEELQTKKLAQRALDRRLDPINREDYRPAPAMTIAEFAAKWQETVMVMHKPSTRSSERSHLKTTIVPVFGAVRLRDVSPEMAQKWVSESKGAPKTIHNKVVTFRSLWSTATDWGYVSHDPFRGLKLPEIVESSVYCFSLEETLAIIDKAEGKWKLLFRVIAESGMRPGEAAGLLAIGVTPRRLKVMQSVWQQQVQTPKTKKSIREFSISESLGRDLLRFIEESGPNEHGLVFTTEFREERQVDLAQASRLRALGLPWRRVGKEMGVPYTSLMRAIHNPERTRSRERGGKPLSMDNFRGRVLEPILADLGIRAKLDRLGIDRCGNYAFRHMNATLMDEMQVPLKTRQSRLGHAQIETTMKHYTHPVTADDLATADALGALLSPKGTEAVQ